MMSHYRFALHLFDDLWQSSDKPMSSFFLAVDSMSLCSIHQGKTPSRRCDEHKDLDTHRRPAQCLTATHNRDSQSNVGRTREIASAYILQCFDSCTWSGTRDYREHGPDSIQTQRYYLGQDHQFPDNLLSHCSRLCQSWSNGGHPIDCGLGLLYHDWWGRAVDRETRRLVCTAGSHPTRRQRAHDVPWMSHLDGGLLSNRSLDLGNFQVRRQTNLKHFVIFLRWRFSSSKLFTLIILFIHFCYFLLLFCDGVNKIYWHLFSNPSQLLSCISILNSKGFVNEETK